MATAEVGSLRKQVEELRADNLEAHEMADKRVEVGWESVFFVRDQGTEGAHSHVAQRQPTGPSAAGRDTVTLMMA